MTDHQMTQPPATQDARELLARLYREIGLSAVSAALDLPQPERTIRTKRDIPAPASGEGLAA